MPSQVLFSDDDKELSLLSRHYDLLSWTVTTLWAAAIGGLLLYCHGLERPDFWLITLGILLSLLAPVFTASFRRVRFRVHEAMSDRVRHLHRTVGFIRQWPLLIIVTGLLLLSWSRLLYLRGVDGFWLLVVGLVCGTALLVIYQFGNPSHEPASRPVNETTPMLAEQAKIFLVPNSVLVGALGVANTDPLKTGISILGLLATALWLIGAIEGLPRVTTSRRARVLLALPFLFLVGWIISAVVHGYLWSVEPSRSRTANAPSVTAATEAAVPGSQESATVLRQPGATSFRDTIDWSAIGAAGQWVAAVGTLLVLGYALFQDYWNCPKLLLSFDNGIDVKPQIRTDGLDPAVRSQWLRVRVKNAPRRRAATNTRAFLIGIVKVSADGTREDIFPNDVRLPPP